MTCHFSTFSRAWHGLHFQRTSDWFTAFYTFVVFTSAAIVVVVYSYKVIQPEILEFNYF